jgi:hypothetical protein
MGDEQAGTYPGEGDNMEAVELKTAVVDQCGNSQEKQQ